MAFTERPRHTLDYYKLKYIGTKQISVDIINQIFMQVYTIYMRNKLLSKLIILAALLLLMAADDAR